MADLDFLISLGFEEAGQWVLADGRPRVQLLKHQAESCVLYAFISERQVLYIGKSSRTLKARLYGYERPGPTQRTNIANHKHIREALLQGTKISTLVLVPREQILYHGVPVNLAAGLEDVLISRIRPKWNRLGCDHSGDEPS